MKLLNIGFGNMVSTDRLIAIVSPDSAPIKRMIQEGRVAVNGETCTMRGKKLRPGDRAAIDGETELLVR